MNYPLMPRFDTGGFISTREEYALRSFARKCRRRGIQRGKVTVNDDVYRIFVGQVGYTILSINGVRNPYLKKKR